jgi:peptide-methionine (S)-S-oxide reductase
MTKKATFGAGCFWGVEEVFRTLNGVVSTCVGYIGGNLKNPNYKDVCTDKTGHAEAVEITFNPDKITYKKLLEVFWANHNPTTFNRQGPDEGAQYRSAIFYHDSEQKESAEKMLKEFNKSGKFKKPIVTQIMVASEFFKAEEYHQKYLFKKGKPSCSA